MTKAVKDKRIRVLPGRTGPILDPLRRGNSPGDRVALAVGIPTIKPGGRLDGLKINDYADRRRASFGFTKESMDEAEQAGRRVAGPGWHCTPPGVIFKGGSKKCGKATCLFCWARAVGQALDGLHARWKVCEAAGVPCSFSFQRSDLFVTRGQYGPVVDKARSERKSLKKEVDSRKAGTPAGIWSAFSLLPLPASLSDPQRRPRAAGGGPADGVLCGWSVRTFEGPAVREVMESKPGRRELNVPGELLEDCLTATGLLTKLFTPPVDPAAASIVDSREVRELLGKGKRVTNYGTLRPGSWDDPISGNREEADAIEPPVDREIADVPADRPSKRPAPMRPKGALPDKPR